MISETSRIQVQDFAFVRDAYFNFKKEPKRRSSVRAEATEREQLGAVAGLLKRNLHFACPFEA